ncbi:aryl-sulfate sulfotransferase [Winogradskyella maritima]|uniref:Aryl-sulfate sulfotransferase n=1 Tax=Winogradskyella maritima TaxID=1517766 RepID=A0ABV8ANG5_9FLAO|nr:aryl-sulfate sulfotransferase [Winogradskyella maritima]
MKRILLLIISILSSGFISFSQNTLGNTLQTASSAPGYTLFTASTETYLINNCGEVVNQWSSTFPPGNAVYLREDGSILRAGRTSSSDITFGGQGGVIEIFDWDGTMTWQYFYDTPQIPGVRQHHDIYPMPNGNVLILAATIVSESEALALGRDPSLLPEGRLYNERILEVTPSGLNGATEVWQWNIIDHVVSDCDDMGTNCGMVADNPRKLDINFVNGGSGGANWLHINSVQYNENLDQIILSSRNLSEIYIIDHSTTTAEAATSSGGTYGQGGDFLWRWGNPQSYDQGTEADRQLFGQHYPHIIPDGLTDAGKLIIYNNGNGRDPLFSEVDILSLPQTVTGFYDYTPGTAYGPTSPDYTYEDPTDPTDFFSAILSSAQRLPNGNTLICEGINGRFFEIDAMENMVWEYISPVNSNTGAIASQGDDPASIANLSFRALKYDPSYTAFDGRDLTPGNPIENNSSSNVSCTLNESSFDLANISIYPNPIVDYLSIESSIIIEDVIIYDLRGTKVLSKRFHSKIDLSFLPSGIYILKLISQNKSITKKIVKQ